MQSEAIWIIDEDQDDRELVRQAWKELELANELCFLDNADDVVEKTLTLIIDYWLKSKIPVIEA